MPDCLSQAKVDQLLLGETGGVTFTKANVISMLEFRQNLYYEQKIELQVKLEEIQRIVSEIYLMNTEWN